MTLRSQERACGRQRQARRLEGSLHTHRIDWIVLLQMTSLNACRSWSVYEPWWIRRICLTIVDLPGRSKQEATWAVSGSTSG